MSKKISKKKVVEITESKLVDLIDNIVEEAVAQKKKQWIAENAANSGNLLEERIKGLEAKLNKLTSNK